MRLPYWTLRLPAGHPLINKMTPVGGGWYSAECTPEIADEVWEFINQ